MTDATFGFDSAFLHRLERMAVLSRRRLASPSSGLHRSPRHGSSVEFADYRDYTVGDDFRRVDWKAYARLDRLFLRLYSAEDSSTVTLLLDRSSSMSFGAPPKALTAARLAAVFSLVALHTYDRVAVAGWAEGIDRYLPPQSGTGAVGRVWRFIADLMSSPAARTDLGALRTYARLSKRPGLAIVISDLLTDSDWRSGLRALQASGQEVHLIQVLSPDELRPELHGDWRLRDAESDLAVEVSVSQRLLRRYEDELTAHTEEIQGFCRHAGITYLQLGSDASLPDTVLTTLRRAGVIG